MDGEKFELDDLVLLGAGKTKGYVARVETIRDPFEVFVRLLDDTLDGVFLVPTVGLIKTGKKADDLAPWSGLDAARVDWERGMVDFSKGYGSKKTKKKKVKSPDDLIAEALIKLAKKQGLGGELMRILES